MFEMVLAGSACEVEPPPRAVVQADDVVSVDTDAFSPDMETIFTLHLNGKKAGYLFYIPPQKSDSGQPQWRAHMGNLYLPCHGRGDTPAQAVREALKDGPDRLRAAAKTAVEIRSALKKKGAKLTIVRSTQCKS